MPLDEMQSNRPPRRLETCCFFKSEYQSMPMQIFEYLLLVQHCGDLGGRRQRPMFHYQRAPAAQEGNAEAERQVGVAARRNYCYRRSLPGT
jgi:hypothetical protein